LAWSEEFGGRALRNAYFDRWHDRLDELAADDAAAAELAQGQRSGDPRTSYVYAGQGAGLLREERSVAALLEEVSTGAEALLRRF
jgi:nitronate monooxygenase